jgi:hypothetical protein
MWSSAIKSCWYLETVALGEPTEDDPDDRSYSWPARKD